MSGLARAAVGYACIGLAYQSAKKAIKADSMLGGGLYSGLTGLFATGAYRLLNGDVLVERIRQLLANENPETATRIARALCEQVPSLEERTQTGEGANFIRELKKQLMRERRY